MNRNGNKIQLLAIYFIGLMKSFMCSFPDYGHRRSLSHDYLLEKHDLL